MTQIEVSFSAFSSIFDPFWLNILTCTVLKYCSNHFLNISWTPLDILHNPKSCLVAFNGLKMEKNWLKLMFHFCIFHQFFAQFGSIFWLELHQYLTFVISWHHLDIPSYPTYPQKLFCSLLITLKWPINNTDIT